MNHQLFDEELINMFESEKPAEPKKSSNKKKGKNNANRIFMTSVLKEMIT
jgi:hypothetical protein